MWVFSESSLYLWILHLLFWENWSGTIWSLPRRGAQDNHKIFTKRFKFQGSKVPVCEHGKCTNTSRCLISSPQGAHFTPDLSVCEHLRKSHINTWHFSLVPGNGAIHYEHVQEGISGVGVRREGGGNGEVRRGRRGVQVKTDNTQRTKLLTCRVWTTSAHSPRDANLRLSGQVLQRIVPSCVMARHSQWQETVGCRAVPLASFTSAKVTDHIWNWCHVHGFLKGLRIGESQGEGRIHRWGTQPPETHTGQFRTARARQPVCVYFQLKVFSFVNHHLFLLRKATQSNRLQDTICVHFDSSSCHKTPSCTVIIQNAKNKVLLVTRVKMKLTAQRNTKQKEISVGIQRDAWQYYPPKNVAKSLS